MKFQLAKVVGGVVVGTMMLAWTSMAAAKTCDLAIEGNDQMQFNKKELVVDADCTEVKITLKHVGKLTKQAMGHNIVLSKTSDMPAIGADGLKAGLANNYLPKGDKRVIAASKLLGGGESDSITVKKADLKAAGDVSFFCTFPGHSGLMKGKVVVK